MKNQQPGMKKPTSIKSSALQFFKKYGSNVNDAEKFHFDNGDAIALGVSHDKVKAWWNYGIFYWNDGGRITIYKWHALLPKWVVAPTIVKLTNIKPNHAIAAELVAHIENRDFVPVINTSK